MFQMPLRFAVIGLLMLAASCGDDDDAGSSVAPTASDSSIGCSNVIGQVTDILEDDVEINNSKVTSSSNLDLCENQYVGTGTQRGKGRFFTEDDLDDCTAKVNSSIHLRPNSSVAARWERGDGYCVIGGKKKVNLEITPPPRTIYISSLNDPVLRLQVLDDESGVVGVVRGVIDVQWEGDCRTIGPGREAFVTPDGITIQPLSEIPPGDENIVNEYVAIWEETVAGLGAAPEDSATLAEIAELGEVGVVVDSEEETAPFALAAIQVLFDRWFGGNVVVEARQPERLGGLAGAIQQIGEAIEASLETSYLAVAPNEDVADIPPERKIPLLNDGSGRVWSIVVRANDSEFATVVQRAVADGFLGTADYDALYEEFGVGAAPSPSLDGLGCNVFG